MMKSSDSLNQSLVEFTLRSNNKSLKPTLENLMAVSNSNTNPVVLAPLIPSIHTQSGCINNSRAINVNDFKNCNLTILTKNSTNNQNTGLVSQIIGTPNNSIKLLNLAKAGIKDSSNSNSINLQIIPSNFNHESALNNASVTLSTSSLTSAILPPPTPASSISCTRLILQGSSQNQQHQYLSQNNNPTNITIIPSPSHTDHMSSSTLSTNSNPLIKSTNFVLKSNKSSNHAIRPITALSAVKTTQNIKKSPPKPLNNISLTTGVKGDNMLDDSKQCTPLKYPLKYHQNTTGTNNNSNNNNNIRLALTGSIPHSTNSNIGPKQIQVISPKSRKRTSSPSNLLQDCVKPEEASNVLSLNSQNSYSPTRKRARKQHLKSLPPKSSQQKPLTTLSPTINAKTIIQRAPNTTSISSGSINQQNNISDSIISAFPMRSITCDRQNSTFPKLTISQNKSSNPELDSSSTHIRLEYKSAAQRPNSIMTSPRSLILSPKPSPSNLKNKTILASPQKIYHITTTHDNKSIFTPSNNSNNFILPKSESLVNSQISNTDAILCNATTTIQNDSNILPSTQLKIEPEIDIPRNYTNHPITKFSICPFKYNWNSRKNHFDKRSDVKFRKSRIREHHKSHMIQNNGSVTIHTSTGPLHQHGTIALDALSSTGAQPAVTPTDNISHLLSINHNSGSNYAINSTNNSKLHKLSNNPCNVRLLLYKASQQLLTQKSYDEENLAKFTALSSKFKQLYPVSDELKPEPQFHNICTVKFNENQRQLASPVELLSSTTTPSSSSSHLCINTKANGSMTNPLIFHGISSDDIIVNSSQCVNSLPLSSLLTSSSSSLLTCSQRSKHQQQQHICTDLCQFYSTQIHIDPYPPQTARVLDLLESLIIKERRLIERQSEIYLHCEKLLRDYPPTRDDLFSVVPNANVVLPHPSSAVPTTALMDTNYSACSELHQLLSSQTTLPHVDCLEHNDANNEFADAQSRDAATTKSLAIYYQQHISNKRRNLSNNHHPQQEQQHNDEDDDNNNQMHNHHHHHHRNVDENLDFAKHNRPNS